MADLKYLSQEWPAINRRLDEALSLEPGQRDTWLDALVETDSVKQTLRRLLQGAAAVETDDYLGELPKVALGPTEIEQANPADAAHADAIIGPYRLIRELGVGGMGQVWLAERVDGGLKREVALKLPHLSWSRGLADRMSRERDILASLDHPNIARIYDAGLDEQGRPYLALEYVEGEPIDVYGKKGALSVPDRLMLVLQVARAVAHAHARLVVHRDLKPANILVTAEGQVRLLDFGIAKLMEGDLTRETQLTQQSGRALTRDYASPEQIRGEPLGTASDVYSLGVVAYELLTEAKPYRLKRGSAAALEEAIESVDVRPASAAGTGRSRRRALKGDLDAILNKALKKNVAERYASVEAFAQDIERHLGNLPVQARPDSLGYRMRKFVRRNMVPLTAATAVSVSLIAGLSVAILQTREARAQAHRAAAVQAFIRQVFGASNPQQAQGRDIGARELLRLGAARLETDLQDQPDVLADLQHEVGEILAKQGANAEAKPHFEKAITLYERLGLGATEAAVQARLALSDVLINESQYTPARALAQRCLDIAMRRFGSPPAWALHARANLAFISAQQGEAKAAAATLEQALTDHRRAGFPPSVETADALSDLGHAHMALGQYEQARDAYVQSVTELASVPSSAITDQLSARMNVQYARLFLEENDAVAHDMPELVAALDRHLGPKAAHTLNARCLWAQALVATGHYDEGLQLQRDNVATAQTRDTLGGDVVALQQGLLAILLRLAARYDEGLPLAEQALAYMDAKQPAPHWRGEKARLTLGDLQRGSGQREAGLHTLLMSQERARTIPGHLQDKNYAELLQSLALAQHDLGHHAEASRDIAQALAIHRAAAAPSRIDTLRCAAQAAWLAAWDRPVDAAAEAAFDEAAKAYALERPAGHPAHAELALLRADLHERAGRAKQASEERAAAAQAWRAALNRDWKPPLVLLH